MINKRLFGSDISPQVKGILKARQKVAASPGPHDSIKVVIDPLTGEKLGKPIKDFLPNVNFSVGENTSLVDLYSRTPFIRMWTALSVIDVEKEIVEETYESTDLDLNAYQTDYQGTSIDKYTVGTAVSDTLKSSIKLTKTPVSDQHNKIYVLGNYNLDTLEKNPNEPVVDFDLDDVYGDVLNQQDAYITFPSEHQVPGDNNKFLRPQAGITGLNSSTEGKIGVIKKTTVNFVVHNFHDFDKIYSKYFLRPGAQLFVDWGWDTSLLYDPNLMVDKEKQKEAGYSNFEQVLYGEAGKEEGETTDGYVTKSMGNMETIMGIVTNYTSNVQEDGSVVCSVEITSKNMALLGNEHSITSYNNTKKRVEHMLDNVIFFDAIAKLLPKVGECVLEDGQSQKVGKNVFIDTTENECRKHAEDRVVQYRWTLSEGSQFSSFLSNLPNKTFSAENYEQYEADLRNYSQHTLHGIQNNQLTPSTDAVVTGVYLWKGKPDEAYISWGYIEDNILNVEFGFGDDEKGINKGNDFNVRFDSSDSFTTWQPSLMARQTLIGNHYKKNRGPKVLWPSADPIHNINEKGKKEKGRFSENFGWDDSYNVRESKTPSNAAYGIYGGEILDPDGIDADGDGLIDKIATPEDFSRSKTDIELRRIPLREVFIKVSTLKNSLGIASDGQSSFDPDSFLRAINKLLTDINEDTYGILDWTISSDGSDDTKIKIVDRNVLDIEHKRLIYTKAYEDIFNFDVMSKNSIVNTYNLSFDMPTGKISDMYAIQGMSAGDKMLPNSATLDSLLSEQEMEHIDIDDTGEKTRYVEYQPAVGSHRFTRIAGEGDQYDFWLSGYTKAIGSITDNLDDWGDPLGSATNFNFASSDNFEKPGSVIFHNTLSDTSDTDDSTDEVCRWAHKEEVDFMKNTYDGYQNFYWGYASRANYIGNYNVPDISGQLIGDVYPQIDQITKKSACNNFPNLDSIIETIVNGTRFEVGPDGAFKNIIVGGPKTENVEALSLSQQFAYRARGEFFKNFRPSPLPIYLTLGMYGISNLVPGDIFRVDYLPSKYLNTVYFQVIKVKHQVTESGWTTTLETQFRVRAGVTKKIKFESVDKNVYLHHQEMFDMTNVGHFAPVDCCYKWYQDYDYIRYEYNKNKKLKDMNPTNVGMPIPANVCEHHNYMGDNLHATNWYGTPFEEVQILMKKIQPYMHTATQKEAYPMLEIAFSFEGSGHAKGGKDIFFPAAVFGSKVKYLEDTGIITGNYAEPRPKGEYDKGEARIWQGWGAMMGDHTYTYWDHDKGEIKFTSNYNTSDRCGNYKEGEDYYNPCTKPENMMCYNSQTAGGFCNYAPVQVNPGWGTEAGQNYGLKLHKGKKYIFIIHKDGYRQEYGGTPSFWAILPFDDAAKHLKNYVGPDRRLYAGTTKTGDITPGTHHQHIITRAECYACLNGSNISDGNSWLDCHTTSISNGGCLVTPCMMEEKKHSR